MARFFACDCFNSTCRDFRGCDLFEVNSRVTEVNPFFHYRAACIQCVMIKFSSMPPGLTAPFDFIAIIPNFHYRTHAVLDVSSLKTRFFECWCFGQTQFRCFIIERALFLKLGSQEHAISGTCYQTCALSNAWLPAYAILLLQKTDSHDLFWSAVGMRCKTTHMCNSSLLQELTVMIFCAVLVGMQCVTIESAFK